MDLQPDADGRGTPSQDFWVNSTRRIARPSISSPAWVRQAHRVLAAQSQESLAPTAWNNRLSSLAARGLLIERRSGKTKTFAPVLEVA